MVKLDMPLEVLGDVVLLHAFNVTLEDPGALLQSRPELCVVYDGFGMADVLVEDVMLFILMPIAGLLCCCENELEPPIPGLVGAIAGNEEFNEVKVLSGVIVLLFVCGADRLVGGGETGGLDHENVAAGEGLFEDLP